MSFEFDLKKLQSVLFLAKTRVSTKRRVCDLFGVEFMLISLYSLGPYVIILNPLFLSEAYFLGVHIVLFHVLF